MKIFLTAHSKQRRPHFRKKEDQEIIPWINYFIDVLDLKNKEDGKYKIRYKGKSAVIKKEINKIVIITIRGFEKENFEYRENFKLSIYKLEDEENKIYRKNFNGNTKLCGLIKDGVLELQEDLFDKYNMPEYTTESNIEDYIYLDRKSNRWILKDFERNESFDIFRKKNNELIKCGYFRNNKVNLHFSLLKYIPREIFFKRKEEDLISFEDNRYMLKKDLYFSI